MKVNMQIERLNVSQTTGSTQTAARAKPATAPDLAAEFEATHRLNQVLTNTTGVRADQVARAKELLADPNYPSPELLGRISGLLANRWPAKNA